MIKAFVFLCISSSVSLAQPLFEYGDALGIQGEYHEVVYLKAVPDSLAETIDSVYISNETIFRFFGIDGFPVNGFVRVCPYNSSGLISEDEALWINSRYIVVKPIAHWLSIYEYWEDTVALSLVVKYWEEKKDSNWKLDSYSMAYFCLGVALENSHEYRKAIYYYSKCIQALPTKDAYALRGILKIKLNDLRGGLSDLKNGYSFNSESINRNKLYSGYLTKRSQYDLQNVNRWIGYCSYQLKQYKSVILHMNVAIKEDSDDGMLYYYRGLAYISLKETGNGCADLSRAGELGVDAYDEISKYCNE